MLLGSPTMLSRRRALCRAARPKGAPLGPGKGALSGSIGEICGRAAVGPCKDHEVPVHSKAKEAVDLWLNSLTWDQTKVLHFFLPSARTVKH
jgi:hypothetical protein